MTVSIRLCRFCNRAKPVRFFGAGREKDRCRECASLDRAQWGNWSRVAAKSYLSGLNKKVR